MPPVYVKPYVKRHKNDAADAEAICEAATRATMRFVAVKSEAQQGCGMEYRTRNLLVGQRTQARNALRSARRRATRCPKGSGSWAKFCSPSLAVSMRGSGR